jgi:hypothetical protein
MTATSKASDAYRAAQDVGQVILGYFRCWHQPAVVRDQPYARYGRELRTLLDRARPPPLTPSRRKPGGQDDQDSAVQQAIWPILVVLSFG